MEFEYVHEKSRREESIALLKSLNLGDSVSSAVYLHVLDVIGAISCLSKKSKSKRSQIEVAEQKLFWKILGEISSLHANQDGDEEKNPALSTVLQLFPKEKPTEDWLPLHFALSLKNIDLEINQALMTAQPNRIHTSIIATNLYWLDYKWTVPDNDFMLIDKVPAVKPYHLAFMRKEPCPGLIDQLLAFDAHFASSGASDGSLPLHFAAQYSNSVDLIRMLADLYPAALRRKNKSGETPIYMIESNGTPAASEILTYFIAACPESLRRTNNLGNLPLHTFASNGCNPIDMINIALLIDAYPDALGRRNNDGKRPIELAAESASMEVFQVIVEKEDLSRVDESVMHTAVGEGLIRNIEYLHSIKPELLINKLQGRTALQVAIETFGRRGNHGNLIRTIASLSPEALTMTDDRGNNLLHALLSDIFIMNCDDLVEDTMRFLLRSIPGGAIAVNNDGQTPLDVLHAKNNIMSRTMTTQMVAALSSFAKISFLIKSSCAIARSPTTKYNKLFVLKVTFTPPAPSCTLLACGALRLVELFGMPTESSIAVKKKHLLLQRLRPTLFPATSRRASCDCGCGTACLHFRFHLSVVLQSPHSRHREWSASANAPGYASSLRNQLFSAKNHIQDYWHLYFIHDVEYVGSEEQLKVGNGNEETL
eukprot:gene27126-35848_t